MTARATVRQCKTCPWRAGADPYRIPGYVESLHRDLARTTISEGERSLREPGAIMACHYSRKGEPFACAGWLHNQIGRGNNLGVRLDVMRGRLPAPDVDGEQHPDFAATLPRKETAR